MIAHGNLIVDGISFGAGMAYKNSDGEIRQQKELVVIGDSGNVKTPQLMMGVTGQMKLYVSDNAIVSSGAQTIGGTVSPVSENVHVSAIDGTMNVTKLKSGEIALVSPDSDGNWSFDSNFDSVTAVYAWVSVPLSISAAQSTGVEITSNTSPKDEPGGGSGGESGGESGGGSGGEQDTPKAYQISVAFSATPNIINDATYFRLTVQINGPSDLSDIKWTAFDPDTLEEVDLSEADVGLSQNIQGENGSFILDANFTKSGNPYTDFTLYAATDDADGVLSASATTYEAACLSGDTLITLADMSQKRLDELTMDDIVLGGDMMPAKIMRIGRGIWNDKHILYYFDGGTVIDETHEHRFYNVNQGFWQKLKNWKIGDRARRIDGTDVSLLSTKTIKERAEMFGLWVERGSYWANGFLSGDASANQALLADASVDQIPDMVMSLSERDLLQLMGVGSLLP